MMKEATSIFREKTTGAACLPTQKGIASIARIAIIMGHGTNIVGACMPKSPNMETSPLLYCLSHIFIRYLLEVGTLLTYNLYPSQSQDVTFNMGDSAQVPIVY